MNRGDNGVQVSLIIPMYNEQSNLPSAIERLKAWLDGGAREVVFSDDGSVDGSAETVRAAAEGDPRIRLVRGEENLGKGAAVRRGMLNARGVYRIFTDCDLAYGLDALRRVEEKLKSTECDAVIGSRALHPAGYGDYSAMRKLMSKAYMGILKRAAGLAQTDSQCGLKGFRAEAAERIFTLCHTDGFAFDLEVLTWARQLDMRIIEIPVSVVSHSQQSSKVRLVRDSLKMLREVRSIKRRVKDTELFYEEHSHGAEASVSDEGAEE